MKCSGKQYLNKPGLIPVADLFNARMTALLFCMCKICHVWQMCYICVLCTYLSMFLKCEGILFAFRVKGLMGCQLFEVVVQVSEQVYSIMHLQLVGVTVIYKQCFVPLSVY